MSRAPDSCDVAIIGAGAAGACVAYRLALAGVRVALLEKGDWLESRAHDDDELYYYILRKGWPALDDEFTVADLLWEDGALTKPHRMGQSYGAVGGGTIYYAGVSSRFYPADFTKRSQWGNLPGAALADWPKGFYGELEPYYGEAEGLIGVSGDHSRDPNFPRSANPRLLPALPGHKLTELLNAGARALGWNPFPIPLALNSRFNAANGMNWCISSGMCSGYPCAWRAKNAVDDVLLRPQREQPHLQVITRVVARRIEVDANGRARGVVFSQRGETVEHELRCRAVVLGASGILSPLIALLSQSKRFPNGLGNTNDLVGRHLMFHIEGQRGAYFDWDFGSEEFHNLKKTMVSDFYEPEPADAFVNHTTIQAGSKSGPIRFVLSKRPGGWGGEYLRGVLADYMRYHELQAMCEDLPQHDNRVTIDPVHTDADGMPCAHVRHRFHEMDGRAFLATMRRMGQWLEAAGGEEISELPSLMLEWEKDRRDGRDAGPPRRRPYGFHLMGTLRMGEDPDTSVVDRDCRFHEVPNVYCADSSIFPSSTGVNPTLTIQANALRVADRMIARAQNGGF